MRHEYHETNTHDFMQVQLAQNLTNQGNKVFLEQIINKQAIDLISVNPEKKKVTVWEIKTGAPSFGELIRQLNRYRQAIEEAKKGGSGNFVMRTTSPELYNIIKATHSGDLDNEYEYAILVPENAFHTALIDLLKEQNIITYNMAVPKPLSIYQTNLFGRSAIEDLKVAS